MPGQNKPPYVPVMGLPAPPTRPAGARGLANPPGQPPTGVQQGFEGGLDALLGLLGVGPETKANQIGQLISAALPIYLGMKTAATGLPSAPKSGLKIQQHMVEGAVPEGASGYAPLDLYTKRPEHYETEMARHLNLKVDQAEAAQRANPYGLQAIPERDVASAQAYLTHKQVNVKRRTKYRTEALQKKGNKGLSEIADAVARGEDPEAILAQMRPQIKTQKAKVAPGTPAPVRERFSAAKITKPTVVAIRERVWNDPDLSARSFADQIRVIQEEFGLSDTAYGTLWDLLKGNSFGGVGKHPRWTKK